MHWFFFWFFFSPFFSPRKGPDPLRSSTSSFLEVHEHEHLLIPPFLAVRSLVPMLSEFTCVVLCFCFLALTTKLCRFYPLFDSSRLSWACVFYIFGLGIMYGFAFILGNGYGWVLGFGAFCYHVFITAQFELLIFSDSELFPIATAPWNF